MSGSPSRRRHSSSSAGKKRRSSSSSKGKGSGTQGGASSRAREVFGDVKVQQLVPKRELITAVADEQVGHVLARLSQTGILSLPVRQSKDSDFFVGFVDFLDIVAGILSALEGLRRKKVDIAAATKSIFAQPVDNLMNKSGRDPFILVDENDLVADVVEKHLSQGVHRVGVMHDGKLVHVLSQSQVTKWMAKHLDALGSQAEASVQDLGLGTEQVRSVLEHSKVSDAFKILVDLKLSAVAMVNEKGVLTGSLSAHDLKGIVRAGPIIALEQYDVISWRNMVRQMEDVDLVPAIDVPPDAPLSLVIRKLSATMVHRLFVVERSKPVRVITMTDLISLVSGTPRK